MTILLVLIPLSLMLVGFAAWAFAWAVRGGQFDNLDTPALEMLDDECKVIDTRVDASPPGSAATRAD